MVGRTLLNMVLMVDDQVFTLSLQAHCFLQCASHYLDLFGRTIDRTIWSMCAGYQAPCCWLGGSVGLCRTLIAALLALRDDRMAHCSDLERALQDRQFAP